MPHSDLVQSVTRAVAILELVAGSPASMSLKEICEALGLKVSTAHNIVRTLIAKGLLAGSARPVRYMLGPAVGRLAMAYRQHRQTRPDAVDAGRTDQPASPGPAEGRNVAWDHRGDPSGQTPSGEP